LRRQYRATHRIAERGDHDDGATDVGCRDEAALFVDDGVGIAEALNVHEFDLLNVVQRSPGEEMRRTGEQRAIAGDDQRLLVLGEAGGALIQCRGKTRCGQNEQNGRQGDIVFHVHAFIYRIRIPSQGRLVPAVRKGNMQRYSA
jgi:hypothetical protein